MTLSARQPNKRLQQTSAASRLYRLPLALAAEAPYLGRSWNRIHEAQGRPRRPVELPQISLLFAPLRTSG